MTKPAKRTSRAASKKRRKPLLATPLADDFEVHYRQLMNPAFELDASIIGKRDGDFLNVVWQPYMPDGDWELVEVGRFPVGTRFGKVVAALSAKREDCAGPSFPWIEEAVDAWAADVTFECEGVDEALAEWMLLVLADFEGVSLAGVAASASEARVRSLREEHLTLLESGALGYFAMAQRTIEKRRKARESRKLAMPKPIRWEDFMADKVGQLPLGDLLLECLEDWAMRGHATSNSAPQNFLLGQLKGRGSEVIEWLRGTDTRAARLILSSLRDCMAAKPSIASTHAEAVVRHGLMYFQHMVQQELGDTPI